MANRKTPSRKAAVPSTSAGPAETEVQAVPADAGVQHEAEVHEAVQTPPSQPVEIAEIKESSPAAGEAPAVEASVDPTPEPVLPEAATPVGPSTELEKSDKQPRFHLFIIDTGWKSTSATVIRDNFHMIREFQNDDPLYVLTRKQSIELIRTNSDLIGKDPMLIVHDLHARGGRGESGYHGFRLCLGLIKDAKQALEVLQKFLRFVHAHRNSPDIEKDIRKDLQRQGWEGTIEVLREGAQDLME